MTAHVFWSLARDEDIHDSRTGPKYVVIKIFLISFNLQ